MEESEESKEEEMEGAFGTFSKGDSGEFRAGDAIGNGVRVGTEERDIVSTFLVLDCSIGTSVDLISVSNEDNMESVYAIKIVFGNKGRDCTDNIRSSFGEQRILETSLVGNTIFAYVSKKVKESQSS